MKFWQLVTTVAALVFSAIANSAIIDQTTFTNTSFGAGAVGTTIGAPGDPDRIIEASQTVTSGVRGYLSQVDVWVGRQSDTVDDLILTIFDTDISSYPSNALGSFSISSSQIASTSLFTFLMVSIDVSSANLLFDVGESFAIGLSAPDAPLSSIASYWTPYSWGLQGSNPYLDGARYVRELQNGTSWNISGTADQAVRTWVEPAAVPIPATVWLFFSGLVGLFSFARPISINR
ncbi:MAG: hypothetical protein WAT12_13070 [Candidatus Nitrotoga sp.]